MLDFSIIVPVYNAAASLRGCLDSIRAQSVSAFEVILIDDGSSDDSLQICQDYCAADKRFVVYHQKNSGPSAARNRGLEMARGNWVCFVDSDDAISPDYLEQISLVATQQDIDAIFLSYRQLCSGDAEDHIPNISTEEMPQCLMELSEQDMFGYTWIKCFRKDAIGSCRFDTSLNLFEDEVFACQVLASCKRIGFVLRPIYDYVIGGEGTLMGRTHADYCEKCDKVYVAWKTLLANEPQKDAFLQSKANSFVSRCRYYGMERDVRTKDFFRTLKNTSFFQEHPVVSRFDSYVQRERYFLLRLERAKYRFKITLSKWRKH